MIKLPFRTICGLGKLCFFIAVLMFAQQSSAQIVFNWPDFLNNNTGDPADDGPMNYNQGESLTGCTSISFSVQYDSDDWDSSGNLESNDECGSCAGDPLNPQDGDCATCWDFLLFSLEVNGSIELDQLIGTTFTTESETFTWDSGCVDPEDVFDIFFNASSQTWGDGEDIDLTNFSLICYQGVAESDLTIEPGDELCEGDNLTLEVNSTFANAEWYFEGTNIGSGTNIELNGLTTSSSGTYNVETTDDNGCSSTVEFDVLVEEIPMSCPLTSIIQACVVTGGTVEIDLTLYDSEVNCSGSDEVFWFTDPGDIPDSPLADPATFESDGSSVYAVVWNGTCYSSEQLVSIDTGGGIDPSISTMDQCEGENLVFEVMDIPTCGTCEFTWDGPAGSGISGDVTSSDIYQVLNANASMTGTWTVTVTDDMGCSGSTTVDVTVSSSPTGDISGGGDLCPGFCTDATNELTLDLSGGASPYDVTLEISIGILNVPLVLPAFLPNGSISLCIDPSSLLPSISDFDGDGNDDLVIPNIALDFSISLTSIEDSNGCVGTGTGTINYNINPIPNAGNPGGPYELCSGTPFDLTTFNNNINGSETIIWFEDMALSSPIADPTLYEPTTTPTTVYAVVDNGTCLSDPVSLELIEIVQPELDPIDDAIACDLYEFLIPSGSDLGSNITYEDDSGNTFFPGDVTTEGGIYTVTVGDDPACLDSESFEVTVLNLPFIVFPTEELSGCGEIPLPTINVLNFDVSTGVVGYFEDSEQDGMMYNEGDAIDQASGLTSIFVYVGSPECFVEVEIDLIFSSDIEYVLPTYPSDACGDFELLPIGGATAGVAYFTEEDGGGDEYLVGEILEAPGTYTLYVFDPTIDQTCVLNSNISFTITLEEEPIIDAIDDVTVCETEGYELPAITGMFLTGDEGYATETDAGGTLYQPGEIIITSGTIFIYNTAASCPATEVVFNVTVLPAPNAGLTDNIETCIGPVIDLASYLSSDADLGGVFIPVDGSILLTGPNNSNWDTSTGDENVPYVFTYTVSDPSGVCNESSVDISVILTNDVSAGVALPDSTVCSGDMIDLFGLLDGESSGGYFVDQDNPMDTIFTGEWTADGSGTNFTYTIEAADGCNGASSAFDLNVIEMQEVTVDIPVEQLCEGSCIEMIITSNFDTALEFQLIDEEDGFMVYDLSIPVNGMQVVDICADGTVGDLSGNTISLGDNGTAFTIAFAFIQNVADCETDLSNLGNYEIEMISAFEETIVGEVCPGDPFMYQGEEYFDDMVLTGFTAAGCDSTTIIDVVEFTVAENFENDTYCIGTNVPIGGEIYTENTTTDIVLMGASANGCDSIIYIDIAFDNASFNNIFETICADEQEEVGGVIYDINNPMGADTLFNGSVQGCDSIITVMLDFHDEAIGFEMETICTGDTINILGMDFFAGMEQMEIVLANQSEHGCDSIVDVSIDFFPTMEIDEEYEKCEGELLEVNGFEITDDNLVGFYTLAGTGSGCPTVVNYTTQLFAASMIEIDTIICEGESIEINGIIFNQDNTFDESITQTINGCDSTVIINVDIEAASIAVMSELTGSNEYEINYSGTEINDPVWNANVGNLSCENCASTMISVTEDTEVYFSGLTANGCLVADTILLSFLPESVFVQIYTPNVFTPDDDNINNLYIIYGSEGIMVTELGIYDRWGEEVYTAENFMTNDPSVGWNGRFNGDEAADGVYVGRVVYLDLEGRENVVFFDLTLIR